MSCSTWWNCRLGYFRVANLHVCSVHQTRRAWACIPSMWSLWACVRNCGKPGQVDDFQTSTVKGRWWNSQLVEISWSLLRAAFALGIGWGCFDRLNADEVQLFSGILSNWKSVQRCCKGNILIARSLLLAFLTLMVWTMLRTVDLN
jgi:hypothetical protein